MKPAASAVNDGDTLFPQNSYCMRCERGLSTFDTRHRVRHVRPLRSSGRQGAEALDQNSFLNAIAGDWQIGSIFTLSTGFPLTVTSGSDRSNTGAGFDRPNYNTGVDPNMDNHDPTLVQPRGLYCSDVRHVRQCRPQYPHQPVHSSAGTSRASRTSTWVSPNLIRCRSALRRLTSPTIPTGEIRIPMRATPTTSVSLPARAATCATCRWR